MQNDDLHRALGRIEGKIDSLSGWVRRVDKDVEDLKRWRWMVLGGAAVVGGAVSVLVKVL